MHPAVCWVAFIISNILWHFPDFLRTGTCVLRLGTKSSTYASFSRLCYFGGMWSSLGEPSVLAAMGMVPYLLLADLQNTGLAAFLSFYDRIAYPTYANVPHFGVDPLKDQATAGAIMWVPGSIAFIVPAALIAVQFLSPKRMVQAVAERLRSQSGDCWQRRSRFSAIVPFRFNEHPGSWRNDSLPLFSPSPTDRHGASSGAHRA